MAKSSKEIGLEVRSYFAKKGIKLADVARMVGSTPQTVTNQLSGRTFGRNTAKKWAEVFGFSATFLMTGEGSLVPGVEGEAPAPMAAQDGGGACHVLRERHHGHGGQVRLHLRALVGIVVYEDGRVRRKVQA